MPNQLITDRMNLLVPEYKSYLLSGAPGEIAAVFGEPHSFTPGQVIVLENGFVMYLLFFMDMTEFSEYIQTECGLDAEAARLLAAGMHNALPAEVQELVVVSQAEIASSNTPDSSTPMSNELKNDLAEIEKSLHQISPVRTMATDGKQVGYSSTTEDTYQSSQEAIINESK